MVGGSLCVHTRVEVLGGLFMLGPGTENYLPLGLCILPWITGFYSLPVTPSTYLPSLLNVRLTDFQPGRPMRYTCPLMT